MKLVYPEHVHEAMEVARARATVYTQLGDGVWSALVFIAESGALIVGSKITEETLKHQYHLRPASPALATSCSISRLNRYAERGKYQTVVLVMAQINRGPKTWAAIKNLVRNKRVLVVEGLA